MNKKFFVAVMMLSCLFSCGNELDEIKDRIKQLEQEEQDLKNKGNELASEGEKLQDDIDNTQNQINELDKEINKPSLLYFDFWASDNPMQLVENAVCEITTDSIIDCWIFNLMSDKILIPRFDYKGVSLSIDGKKAESGVTAFDFKKPVKLTVEGALESLSYTVNVHSFTGLAVLWVETASRQDIAKTNWNYKASIKLVENIKTRASGDVIEGAGRIVCVETVNWYKPRVSDEFQMAKNDYVLSFNNSVSILGIPANKDWELNANVSDKTMICNHTAYYMGNISNLEFTPRFRFVELMLNGRYYGTYMIGDLIEVGTNRVNVGYDGFLLRVDSRKAGPHVNLSYMETPASILAPVSQVGDANHVYVSNYLKSAEGALFSDDFTNPDTGWQKYLDMDSFVDWYIINEIVKNENAVFQADCYMNMRRGQKLKMGPLYDFSKAFGKGTQKSSDGFVVKNEAWYSRLFQDPSFVEKVKERFEYFYSHKADIISDMNENATYLKYAVQENDNKWSVFTTYNSGSGTWPLYQKEVESLKLWLSKRMDWLNQEISKL